MIAHDPSAMGRPQASDMHWTCQNALLAIRPRRTDRPPSRPIITGCNHGVVHARRASPGWDGRAVSMPAPKSGRPARLRTTGTSHGRRAPRPLRSIWKA